VMCSWSGCRSATAEAGTSVACLFTRAPVA
jgi:hypothetical protein